MRRLLCIRAEACLFPCLGLALAVRCSGPWSSGLVVCCVTVVMKLDAMLCCTNVTYGVVVEVCCLCRLRLMLTVVNVYYKPST
jgi:hypothetical protein